MRLVVDSLAGEAGYRAHDGVVAHEDDDALALAVGHQSGHVADVLGLDVTVALALDGALDRLALARQHRLVKLEIARLDDTHVGGHLLTVEQADEIADDQLLDGDLLLLAVAYNRGRARHHVLDRLHHLAGRPVLESGEGRLEQDDEYEENAEAEIGRIGRIADGSPRQYADNGRHPDEAAEAGEQVADDLEYGILALLRDAIEAILGEELCGRGLVKAVTYRSGEVMLQLIERDLVKVGLYDIELRFDFLECKNISYIDFHLTTLALFST